MDATVRQKYGGATTRALEGLRGMIVSGELSPGEQVRQEEMAEQLNMSRIPVREALNVLANQGVLDHRPNQGYFVVKRTKAERQQISLMLHLLENELVTSVQWPDEAALAQLAALNLQMRDSVARQDTWALVQLNRQFHFEMFSLSPHRLILHEVERLWMLIEPVLWIKFGQREEREKTLAEHDLLVEALRLKDLERYAAAMQQHREPIFVPD
jgi:DNA-binding GntR family transcriptional regulator